MSVYAFVITLALAGQIDLGRSRTAIRTGEPATAGGLPPLTTKTRGVSQPPPPFASREPQIRSSHDARQLRGTSIPSGRRRRSALPIPATASVRI